MIKILTRKGEEILIDLEDYELVNIHTWYLDKGYNTSYAVTEVKGKKIRMHRLIMKCDRKDQFVDHMDGNGLNNQKYNLRVCSQAENNRNAVKSKKSTSKYKGVWFEKLCGKWRAHIRHNRKGINLGLFVDEKEAAKAYNAAALEYFGKFARTNKI